MLSRMRLLRRGSALAALTVVAASLASCTSSHAPAQPVSAPSVSSRPSSTASTAPTIKLVRPDAPLRVSIGQLGGGVRKSRSRQLERALTRPLDSWIKGGFLGGDYPRHGFSDAFTAWTPSAARLARRDSDVTTNAALGGDLVDVVADHQRAKLFVFAIDGRTGGATANVSLRLTGERADGRPLHLVVSGQLYLTRHKETWSIFGYDLHRSVGAS